MSSHNLGCSKLFLGRADRRSVWRFLYSTARPLMNGSALSADCFVDAVTLRDDLAASFLGDRRAVEVTNDIGRARSPTADDSCQEYCADVAECRVVVLALGHHESVVSLGESGVDAASPVCGHEERLA
jgi:hypothetical protein